ncbi:MAG: hypothetical protein ACP5QG_07920 [candidate division WOR-3 bacterium]
MRVAGFDENGLGPRLGPLMVTGVLLEISGDDEMLLANHSGPIDDSKRIFKRDPKSYACGESIALGIIASAGIGVGDTDALREGLGLPDDLPLPASRLPIWCRKEKLPKVETRVLGIRVRATPPSVINRLNKFNHTVSCMIDLARQIMPLDLCVLGKVGGRKFYGPFLWEAFGDGPSTLREEQSESVYLAGGTEWRFLQDADATHLPVAMASIVGKYIRELVMLELNARAGFSAPIPYCSGYHGDPKTPELAKALARVATDPWLIPRER